MMLTIKKGKHYARPARFGFWLDRPLFEWRVRFTESCRYELNSPDQGDWNKLCGFGFLRGWYSTGKWWHLNKWRPKDSARFGWRYRADLGKVEIAAYCYVDGELITEFFSLCEIGIEYDFEISMGSSYYFFHVSPFNPTYHMRGMEYYKSVFVNHKHNKKVTYRKNLYFGGNMPAPNDIHVGISLTN